MTTDLFRLLKKEQNLEQKLDLLYNADDEPLDNVEPYEFYTVEQKLEKVHKKIIAALERELISRCPKAVSTRPVGTTR
jgi:hypothetical protein